MRVFTVGHGTRTAEELVEALAVAGVSTLVDVRRFPSSRRNPQFGGPVLAETLARNGIDYRHEVELGGRRSGEAGEDRFTCISTPAFRSYAARMPTPEWQQALARVLAAPSPCVMCAETPWWRCHRRLIAEQLDARGHEIVHLVAPGRAQPHRRWTDVASVADGVLHLCGEPVA
jgi:uncharacterized protein (DUF488 family)